MACGKKRLLARGRSSNQRAIFILRLGGNDPLPNKKDFFSLKPAGRPTTAIRPKRTSLIVLTMSQYGHNRPFQ